MKTEIIGERGNEEKMKWKKGGAMKSGAFGGEEKRGRKTLGELREREGERERH